MNELHLDLHSKILLGLAEVLADSRAKATLSEIEILTEKCPPVSIEEGTHTLRNTDVSESSAIMNRKSQQAIIALVKYAVKAKPEKQLDLLPHLLAYMRHLPAFQWEPIALNGPPPADIITYSLVAGLLEIGDKCPEHYEEISKVLWNYAECILQLMSENVEFAITFVLPSLAGLSRALQLSPFIYRPSQLLALCKNTQPLICDDTLDLVRRSITNCLRDAEKASYSRRVLQHYWESGTPLSSNRLIHDLLIMYRNVLARVIAQDNPTSETVTPITVSPKRFAKLYLTRDIEKTWTELMQCSASRKDQYEVNEEKAFLNQNIRSVYNMVIGYHQDISRFAKKNIQEGREWAADTYMQEIMGTSLHVASLCSVYLHEVDEVLMNHIEVCLFNDSHDPNPWVHIASLDAAVLIAVNFARFNPGVISNISRFLATPSPLFELQIEKLTESVSIQQFVTVRLAQCVQAKPQAQVLQAAVSTIYALLNETTRYTSIEGNNFNSAAPGNLSSNTPALEQLDEKQKQQVCENVLSATVGIAVHLKDDQITGQAFAILAQRCKSLSHQAIASLVMNLVDLALVSPKEVFVEIIGLLAAFTSKEFRIENSPLYSHILAAQSSLAKRLSARPEYYQLYLSCLLNLFIRNGNTIQRTMEGRKKDSEQPFVSKLGMIMPVIAVLLEHEDFNPHLKPSQETVVLFRNFWFHCVLIGFVTEPVWVREWYSSMAQISKKTPVLVMETTVSNLERDLEQNSVLRSSNVANYDLAPLRQKLNSYFPSFSSDTKNFTLTQAVFTLSVYHIEMMRSRVGDCSFILGYFMNESISSSTLVRCLESVAERITQTFVKDASVKALGQKLEQSLHTQTAALLELCCSKRDMVRSMAIKNVKRIVSSFSQVFADGYLITLLFELVQLTWLSCEAEFRDEDFPTSQFTSARVGVAINLGNSFAYRRKVCTELCESTYEWVRIAFKHAPIEVSGLLKDYLSESGGYSYDGYGDSTHLGRALALEIGKSSTKDELPIDFVPKLLSLISGESSDFMSDFQYRQFYSGEVSGIEYLISLRARLADSQVGNELMDQIPFVIEDLASLVDDTDDPKDIPVEDLHRVLYRAAGFAIALPKVNADLIRYLVHIPVMLFTPQSLDIGTKIWNWILVERPEFENKLMIEMMSMWSWTQRHRKGMFSPLLNTESSSADKTTHNPPDKAVRDSDHQLSSFLFNPHICWISFINARFCAIRHKSKHLVNMMVRLLQESFQNAHLMSTHPLARYARFSLLKLGLKVLQSTRMEVLAECKLRSFIYDAAFDWFSQAPKWHYGARKGLALMERKMMIEFHNAVYSDSPSLSYLLTCASIRSSSPKAAAGRYTFLKDKTKEEVIKHHKQANKLLLLLIESEFTKLSVWCKTLEKANISNTINPSTTVEGTITSDDSWKEIIRFAWTISPRLAVQLDPRFAQPIVKKELNRLITNNALDVVVN